MSSHVNFADLAGLHDKQIEAINLIESRPFGIYGYGGGGGGGKINVSRPFAWVNEGNQRRDIVALMMRNEREKDALYDQFESLVMDCEHEFDKWHGESFCVECGALKSFIDGLQCE